MSSGPFRLNPLWPEAPQRHYAIEPIDPAYTRASSVPAPSLGTSSSLSQWAPHEELIGEAIDVQELELAEMVQRRQHMQSLRQRETEQERQQDWEREQYYIRLSAEARRVTQMQDQQQGMWYNGRPRNSHYHPMPPPPVSDLSRLHSTSSGSRTEREAREAREPSEPPHKVFLLNCKHCGNFLSDRGMKAVLLLKPNITLYSTDAAPTTCGPYYTSTSFHGGIDPIEPPIERTCNCLTQSLGCYGCGNQVGYSILSPCDQCTSSVQKHQRSSNGHRTVLHCSEITVRERRYVPGEPGVRAASFDHATNAHRAFSSSQASHRRLTSRAIHESAFDRNTALHQYEMEEEDMDQEKTDAATQAFYQQAGEQAQQRAGRSARTSGRSSNSPKEGRVLRRGDVVLWSDLVSGGERTQPFDPDPILALPTAGR